MENGAIAQLGERFNGIEEVVGSIPSGSTIFPNNIKDLLRLLVGQFQKAEFQIPNRYHMRLNHLLHANATFVGGKWPGSLLHGGPNRATAIQTVERES
jgi:hypothetical protein